MWVSHVALFECDWSRMQSKVACAISHGMHANESSYQKERRDIYGATPGERLISSRTRVRVCDLSGVLSPSPFPSCLTRTAGRMHLGFVMIASWRERSSCFISSCSLTLLRISNLPCIRLLYLRVYVYVCYICVYMYTFVIYVCMHLFMNRCMYR